MEVLCTVFRTDPSIPQEGEYLEFSVLRGMGGLSKKEKALAEERSAFIDDDNEENECGNPVYIVTSRTFHNNGVVELIVRMEEWVLTTNAVEKSIGSMKKCRLWTNGGISNPLIRSLSTCPRSGIVAFFALTYINPQYIARLQDQPGLFIL